MSLIEDAARRLEELRRAGVDMTQPPDAPSAPGGPEVVPTPEGFVTPDAPSSQLADEFRVLKRPIIRNALGKEGIRVKNGNLVMVTSALPGEGKTFTSLNLALSVALE